MEENLKLNELITQVGAMLAKDIIDPDATLSEIGIDSLNVVELILICEQLYPNLIDPQNLSFDEFTTLREVEKQLLENSREIA